MIAQVATGITTKFTGSALATALTGGLYRDKAKQGVTFPYGVFTVISDINTDTYNSDMEYFRIQFNLWHQATSTITDPLTSLDTLESALRTLYDRATLTVTNWNNTKMRWIGSRPAYSEDDRIFGTIIEYETYIDKAR